MDDRCDIHYLEELYVTKEKHGLDSIYELGSILDETYRAKDDNSDTSSDESHDLPSLLTAPKLVSALKGGREKEGLPVKKLSVSWASDVYDPPPTSVSHYPKKKTQQKMRSNKKHGKGKQKGKNVKDKKHYYKMGSKSNNTDKVIPASDYRSSSELLDFTVEQHGEINCPESNCGSSYRGKARSSMHFAYAEAT